MLQFLEYAQDLVDTFMMLGDKLTDTFYVAGLGDVSIAGLIIGGGVFTVLVYKVTKFVVDIFG